MAKKIKTSESLFQPPEGLKPLAERMRPASIDEMVGHAEALEMAVPAEHWKAKYLDLSVILHKPAVPASVAVRARESQDHGLDKQLDVELIRLAQPALERGEQLLVACLR